MSRIPFDPPYTVADLPQLDALHEAIGLGDDWKASERRLSLSKSEIVADLFSIGGPPELVLSYHESHDLVATFGESHCAKCWVCQCHSPEGLTEPCKGLDLSRNKEQQ